MKKRRATRKGDKARAHHARARAERVAKTAQEAVSLAAESQGGTKPLVLPARKPAKNSRMRALPEAIQQELLRLATSGQSWREIAKWLEKKTGMVVKSDTTLSDWYSWRVLRQQLEGQLDQVNQLREFLARELPAMPEEKLERFGQAAFSALALKTGDPAIWAKIQNLNLKARELAVQERRVRLLEKKAEQAEKAEGVVKSSLTAEEKMAEMERIFGIAKQ